MEKPNLSYIEQLSGGDNAFTSKLIQVIQTEFPEERLRYEQKMEQQDWQGAAIEVHKVKHKISIFGLKEGYETAQDFETALREGRIDGRREFDAILNSLANYIDQLLSE